MGKIDMSLNLRILSKNKNDFCRIICRGGKNRLPLFPKIKDDRLWVCR